MSWLSSKKKTEEKAARLQAEREEASRRNVEKAAAIDASSKKNHAKQFTNELDLIKSLPYGTDRISNVIKGLSSAFDTIDLSQLSPLNKAQIYDVIYLKMPKACSAYKAFYLNTSYRINADVYAYEAQITDYNCSVATLFKNMIVTMEQVRVNQNEIQSVQQKALPQSTTREHEFSAELRATIEKLLRDDDFSKQFRRLDELVKRINSNNANTVEDAHFLEQVVKEYIPGAISLYALFLDADSIRKSKARVNLKEQFDLIEDKLMDMASKLLDRDLAKFEAKTSFLRAKIEDEKLGAAPARKALTK